MLLSHSMSEEALRSNRRQRGVARASLTRLERNVAEIECDGDCTSTTRSSVQRLQKRLKEIMTDSKTHHLAVVDYVDEGQLEAEQSLLDQHEDKMLRLSSWGL